MRICAIVMAAAVMAPSLAAAQVPRMPIPGDRFRVTVRGGGDSTFDGSYLTFSNESLFVYHQRERVAVSRGSGIACLS